MHFIYSMLCEKDEMEWAILAMNLENKETTAMTICVVMQNVFQRKTK